MQLKKQPEVNNDYYNHLGDDWYEANNDPIAILRREQYIKNPWIKKEIIKDFGRTDLNIADIGCGAGFLTNYLAGDFKNVYGLDASSSTLKIAAKKDETNSVHYTNGNAYQLPYADESMDVVCAMDFLEHVDSPKKIIEECSRVLKPNGLFFFHTFNRNFFAWLVVIKFMEWFIPKTPKNLHVLHLFIKPAELDYMMQINKLVTIKMVGIGPRFNFAFLKSILKRQVLKDFKFKVSKSLSLGYMGYAKKKKIH